MMIWFRTYHEIIHLFMSALCFYTFTAEQETPCASLRVRSTHLAAVISWCNVKQGPVRVLLCRKLNGNCVIRPTCPLSGAAAETGHYDEAEEKGPAPLHAGSSLLQHRDKDCKHRITRLPSAHRVGGLCSNRFIDSKTAQAHHETITELQSYE